jgi:hypothetical protein
LSLERDGHRARPQAPLEILQRIERGELTVDAALDALKS